MRFWDKVAFTENIIYLISDDDPSSLAYNLALIMTLGIRYRYFIDFISFKPLKVTLFTLNQCI